MILVTSLQQESMVIGLQLHSGAINGTLAVYSKRPTGNMPRRKYPSGEWWKLCFQKLFSDCMNWIWHRAWTDPSLWKNLSYCPCPHLLQGPFGSDLLFQLWLEICIFIPWKATPCRGTFCKYQDSFELSQGLVKIYVLLQVCLGWSLRVCISK